MGEAGSYETGWDRMKEEDVGRVGESAWNALPGEWRELLDSYESTRDARRLLEEVVKKVEAEESAGATVLPEKSIRYRALGLTKPADCRVVILGQDPYPTPGDATGLSFSVNGGRTLPRSLANIYQELAADVGCAIPVSGDLTGWAEQGVLMLNTSLTVRAREPKSHQALGWSLFTEKIIKAVAMSQRGGVFILWGNEAGRHADLLEEMGQTVIKSSHPSPMGGSCFKGFYGSRPFTRANRELERGGHRSIDWLRGLLTV
jgi:uracil-DNA glycosylase